MAFPMLSDDMMKKAIALDFGAIGSFIVASIAGGGIVQGIFILLSVVLVIVRIVDGIGKIKSQNIKNEYEKQKAKQEEEKHKIEMQAQRAMNQSITASSHEELFKMVRDMNREIQDLKRKESE